VLTNLLSNAIKFTPAGGVVSLEIDCLDFYNDQDSISIKVKDSGVGIPKEQLDKIFEPYYQLNTTAKHKGSGLGLKIVKQLVDLFGGGIEVNSEVNRGTEFKIYMKLQSTQPKLQHEQISKPSNLKILVAEDDEINRLVLQKLLAPENEVKAVTNGVEAIELTNKEKFDLIILDFEMPLMGGIECCNRIKSFLPQDIPVIGLTAHSNDRLNEVSEKANFDLVLTKPIKPGNLYTAIRHFIPAS